MHVNTCANARKHSLTKSSATHETWHILNFADEELARAGKNRPPPWI